MKGITIQRQERESDGLSDTEIDIVRCPGL